MLDRATVSQEVTVMLGNKKAPKVGEVLKIEVISMKDGTALVTRQEITEVSKDGKSFSMVMRLLKHDGTWSTSDDYANTNYKHAVTK